MVENQNRKRILEVGCGRIKAPGAIGVDSNPDATAADVIADVNRSLPFVDNSFDEVRAVHVVEHVSDVMKTVAEMHRVCRPGGTIFLVTPHYTDFSSWCDPTHRWHLNSYSFGFFGSTNRDRHWYTGVELRQRALHIEMASLWKWLGIQWLVNHSDRLRRFWELYPCFIVRGKQIEFTFEVVK
jgi:SAM-dependent methyltransferase